MRSFKQLDFFLHFFTQPAPPSVPAANFPEKSGHDPNLEARARELLRSVNATALLPLLRVEWNPRM